MEHEIEAIWPPSWSTSFVGSGPRTLLGDHVNDRLWCLDFHPGWWAAEGRPAFSLRFLCPAAVLPFVLPATSNLQPSTHTAHFFSTEHSWYPFVSCLRPLRGTAPGHVPEGNFPLFTGGHCPGHVTQDSSPLPVILGTLLQQLFLLTAVWGLSQIQENVCRALQEARGVTASRPGARNPFLKHTALPCSNPVLAILSSEPLPSQHIGSLSEGGSAWPQWTFRPSSMWAHIPQPIPLSLSVTGGTGLRDSQQHTVPYLLALLSGLSWEPPLPTHWLLGEIFTLNPSVSSHLVRARGRCTTSACRMKE